MLLSHPHKSLYDHLVSTRKIGERVFEQKQLNFKSYKVEQLRELNKINLAVHDVGKAVVFFQEYMEDIQNGIERPRHKDKDEKDHGLISGVFAFIIAKKILGDETLAFISFIVVSRHHNTLKNLMDYFSEVNLEKYRRLLDEQFSKLEKEELQKVLDKLGIGFNVVDYTTEQFKEDLDVIGSRRLRNQIKEELQRMEIFLLINFLFSILIFSDKLEAIFHSENTALEIYLEQLEKRPFISSNLVEEYKKTLTNKDNTIACIRERIYQDVINSIRKLDLNRKILSINLPTGSGKTLTALKASLLLKERIFAEKGYNPRIIYVLPYTSVIEQNYEVFEDVLEAQDNRVLLKHHHLSERKYIFAEHEEYKGDIPEHMVETWEAEIVVSTFVQLLHSVFTNRNRQLKKFHNIANAIIILDEVQSIPHKYWEAVRQVFDKMAECLNCYFILMTATMPLIFSESAGEILELAKNKKEYFGYFNRIEIDVSHLVKEMTVEEFKEMLYEDLKEYSDKSFLIVMNTIKSSISLYKHIWEHYKEKAEIYYLSTNIIPEHRRSRIEAIKKSKKRKIIVSTQMIEAGVDIDIDRVYRDLGPIDSINQSAGRCNREWGKEKGKVKLVRLVDESNKGKEYSSYVYDDVILMKATKNVLKGLEIIEEKDILSLAESYFKELKTYGCKDESNDIIKMINKLEYSDAFELTTDKEKNDRVFQLIKQDFETVDLFIEIDESARMVWRRYEALREIKDKFERKKAYNNIRKDFNKYIISVPEKAAKMHMNLDEKNFITKVGMEMLSTTYDLETGFLRYGLTDYIF